MDFLLLKYLSSTAPYFGPGMPLDTMKIPEATKQGKIVELTFLVSPDKDNKKHTKSSNVETAVLREESRS